jgi:tRNA(adenine34) deaminase
MSEINFSEQYFMKQAFVEAQKAKEKNEVPVGAVIVCNNQIIARAHNLTETLNDVTAHAEMLAITAAAEYLGGKYLNECTLYVTL